MNGLHYQKPSTPRWRCAAISRPRTDGGGAGARAEPTARWPQLRYDYRLPAGMTRLPTDNPCLRYEFELRRPGAWASSELTWQGKGGSRGAACPPAGLPLLGQGPGLQ